MSRGELGTAVRRWAPIAAALIGLGAWSARLESAVDGKAPLSAVEQMQGQLTQIQNQLADIAARQRQIMCAGKPEYCR